MSQQIAVQLVVEKRHRQPFIGGRKLYFMLHDDLRKLPHKIGRDALFKLLRDNNLLVFKRQRSYSITNSNHTHMVYPNLIKGLDISQANQVFIADMTYIRCGHRFVYLSVVCDLYSRKIVGYKLLDNLTAEGPLRALKMGLSSVPLDRRKGLIHHSDRGVQYCSIDYSKLLKNNGCIMSMSAKGNPYDNAVMERVMGILKQEFGLNKTFENINAVGRAVDQAIEIYNEERPHFSLAFKTPSQVYEASCRKNAA